MVAADDALDQEGRVAVSATAISLVLVAALVHAGWNLAAKRVLDGGARFVFLYYSVSAIVCAPVAITWLLLEPERPQWSWGLATSVTAVLHVAYGIVLQRGYAVGDLSIVYPVARGAGPLFSVSAAIVLLAERPGWLGVLGALLVVTGVFVIAARPAGGHADPDAARRARLAGFGYGLLTGVAIAGYTLWDSFSVNALGVPPVLYFSVGVLLQSVFLAPYALRAGSGVGRVWSQNRREVAAVGVLSPIAYLLVLFAMRLAPVSLVAPAREFSIVLGALAAWLVLGELNPGRRLLGSIIVVGGIAAIAAA